MVEKLKDNYDKKNIVITGASRGLGLAILERLLNKNYIIHCVCRSLTPELEHYLDSNKNQVILHTFDLEYLDGIPDLVAKICKQYGPIYGLINNAAIGLDGLLATQHQSDIHRILRVNLEAPIIMTKYACRSMLAERSGRIINISSIIAQTGFNGLAVYGSTKAGLEGFTRSLSRELGRVGVTANCIAPGYMETEMTSGLNSKKLESVRRRTSLGLPLPKDVASAAEYLLSEDSSMMTGTIMTIDGGSTA